CPTNAIFDAGTISRQLYDMRIFSEFLGGHTDVDLWFPFYKYGEVIHSWWRNEKNTCSYDGDEIDYIRMKGSWGESEGETIFGKSDRADGYFLIAGAQQKLPPMHSAMLVSDPIQCQEGDGLLKLKFWASPNVRVRVCTRLPSMGKRYQWCSEPLKRNGTKMAKVVIPGTIWYSFEIVIEAYNFTLDAFGKQGGAAIIDDISYNTSAVYQCRMIPHYEPPVKLSPKTCSALHCDFESGSCLQDLDSSDWKTSDDPVGSRSTGIRSVLDGPFAYAVGPGTASIALGPFVLSRSFAVEFCYYIASYRSQLVVYLSRTQESERERLFVSNNVSGNMHHWNCDKIFLNNGTYDAIEFSAEGLKNEYSYLGLDQIDVYDPLLGVSACKKTADTGKLPFLSLR
ncbi:MAM domain-containing protein, partial [Trichostrongylus colubriformis]